MATPKPMNNIYNKMGYRMPPQELQHVSGWGQIIRPSTCQHPCQRQQREQGKPSTGAHWGWWKYLRAAGETRWGLLALMHHPQKGLRGGEAGPSTSKCSEHSSQDRASPWGDTAGNEPSHRCRDSGGRGRPSQDTSERARHLCDQLMKTANKGALQCYQKTYVDQPKSLRFSYTNSM